MALIDHFDPNAGTEPGQNGFERFPSHQFTDGLYLWALGDIGKAALISSFGMTEEPAPDADETQLDELAANYTAAAGAVAKLEYIHKVEAVIRLYEQSRLTQAQAKTFLSIT